MSDTQAVLEQTEATTAPETVAVCPLSPDVLPPNMRKHVEASSPVPLRLMAAKGLLPLSAADMVTAVFMLTFDADEGVRKAAATTAASLPDRILGPAFRDEGVPPPALAYFLAVHGANESYAEMLILNAVTPDESVALIAPTCSAKTAELIGQNQLRLLRHGEIVRMLCRNPAASPALLDGVCDFCVRSGLVLEDVQQMQAARIRLFGPDPAKLPDPGPSAEEILREYKEAADENAAPMEEGKRMSLTQRIMKMNVAEKIKLAMLGNKEARGLLIRDTNKLVALAVIRSPRITDGEVLGVANSRSIIEDVLRAVYSNREWTKNYPLKLALVKNPKTPLAIAVKFLNTLRESEIKDLARNKNVQSGIRVMAKKWVEKKEQPKKEDK